MYNTGKRVGIKRVIEKVYRDWGFNTDIVWADAIEWLSEAINLLGVSMGYEDRMSKELVLTKGRVELPCDIMYIRMVRDFNTQEVLVRSFDEFHLSNYYRCDDEPVAKCNGCHPKIGTYKTNSNFIYTDYDEGSLEIAYRGMPVDEDGMPTIPDNDKYIRFVSLYIAEKIGNKLYNQDKYSERKLDRLQSELAFATGSAKMAMVIPDIDAMQAWTNSSLRIIPTLNSHATGFKHDSQQQRRNTHNSY